MKHFLFILLLSSPLFCPAQYFINKKYATVKKELQQLERASIPRGQLSASSTSITFIKNTDSSNRTTAIYEFDKKNYCAIESYFSENETTFQQLLQSLLAIEKFNWKKLNENQYISDFASKMMVELPAEKNAKTFSILRMEWSQELYQLLLKK